MTRIELTALYNALKLAENGRNTSHPNEGFKQLRELLDMFSLEFDRRERLR